MNGKSIPSDFVRTPSVVSRFLWFVNGRRLKRWLYGVAALLFFFLCIFVEFHTSIVQSWFFTTTNTRVHFNLDRGPSREIAYPRPAPFDDRRGYSKLPRFLSLLKTQDYRVIHQARQSETMMTLFEHGISPPYPVDPAAGLDIRGTHGERLFRYDQSEFSFEKIENVPPLVVKTLLFLENRDLERSAMPWQNPVIEWDRTLKAAMLYVGAKLNLPVPVQGGSTLAVQLEKFRHSPHGRTDTPLEKLRQIVGASLKAYREGPDTRSWRERIIVDYINTVPLAAAPGYGEIHGLGEGLYAWFGMQRDDVVAALISPGATAAKVRAFKHVLALLISVRAPSVYLVDERASLEEKVNQFTRLLARAGIIDWEMAAELQETPIRFLPSAPLPPLPSSIRNKAANAIRTHMMDALGGGNLYDLDRLHLQVGSTFDVALQKRVTDFLNRLADPQFVAANGLNGERLLENADPSQVIYSFLLVEATSAGNRIRVQADNFAAPFDFNRSVKLELGSTAKLRTLTHYLEVMAELHGELSPLDQKQLGQKAGSARDVLTRWVIETLQSDKDLTLQPFLDRAMSRQYSANPHEEFFTGSGLHRFENFDKSDDERVFSLREAFRNSTNLVFIRLMRDLVAYHRGRLPYDAGDVLANPAHTQRHKMLLEIADEESHPPLRRAFQNYANRTPEEVVRRLLGKGISGRRLAILFFAWRAGTTESDLKAWLQKYQAKPTDPEVSRLYRAYHNPRMTLADHAYLLSLHPLDLWGAGELLNQPKMSWKKFYAASAEARRVSSAWLLDNRNRRAQDLRLRIRMEKDAFDRMAPYWQKLGFPFKSMVPTYASAIGSSSDRPVALAELVGVLVNEGVRRPTLSLTHVHFAAGTPYETILEPVAKAGRQMLAPEVARTVRKAMAEVVEQGTARRLKGVFKSSGGQVLTVGGKTGSGDNRFKTFSRTGAVITSRATNRTATFVFYIGDRYFGVITAYVEGREAENYRFTSALPVSLMKLLAPAIISRMENKSVAQFGLRPVETIASAAPAKSTANLPR